MKYETLSALRMAYDSGEFDRKTDIVSVDNDTVSLDVVVPGADADADEEVCVFSFEGRPGDLLIQALHLLGIPAESVQRRRRMPEKDCSNCVDGSWDRGVCAECDGPNGANSHWLLDYNEQLEAKDQIIKDLADSLDQIISWQDHRNHLLATRGDDRLPVLAQHVWDDARAVVKLARGNA